MKDTFSTYHPVITFCYFTGVLGLSMFISHPAFLTISFMASFSYAVQLEGIRKILRCNMLLMLPMLLLVVVINGMFNHYGVTTLYYLKNGNAVTLEAIAYGFIMAVMLAEVFLWFSCYHIVMTSDKFIYLFGRIIPGISLILSMCLRFVPRFTNQMKVISDGQKCIGRDVSNGSIFSRAKHGITILSILITWSLENAIETADSMKARGYGLKGRTAFSIFRFDRRDRVLLGVFIILLLGVGIGIYNGNAQVLYNPKIKISGIPPRAGSTFTYLLFAIFCSLPLGINRYESYRWNKQLRHLTNKSNRGFRTWEC